MTMDIAGDRPPRSGMPGRLRFTVSRGTGPRATIKNATLTVGRGPVPRRASVGEAALVCVRFSRGSVDRGGQAPALR